jgi:sugar O-acyltransferase (sialic acid O-acetyltransferase NeuD family)
MISPTRFAVVGAGGHAKVVIATIEASGGVVVAVLDDDPGRRGECLLGHLVRGPVSDSNVPEGALVVLGIGANETRSELARRLKGPFGTVLHPGAIVHSSVELGMGTVVFAGVVIQPDTRIGRHVIVNTGASIDHDCVLEDFVHVAPGARLAGGVHLGEGVLMGIGSCAVPGVRVGTRAVVGAGGVVVSAIPADVTAVGVPARVTRS